MAKGVVFKGTVTVKNTSGSEKARHKSWEGPKAEPPAVK